MLELVSYGLTGLAAIVVIAFCFAYGETFSPGQEERSIDRMNEAHWPLSRRSCERSTGTGAGTIYSGNPNESVHGEALHG
jgi:hypothetical protein